MPKLTTVFELVDNMSEKIDKIASSGVGAAESLEKIGTAADGAMSNTAAATESIAEKLRSSLAAIKEEYANADYWTPKIGNYDKGFMEELYGNEWLVENGYKTAEALDAEEEMYEACSRGAEALNNALNSLSETQSEYTTTIEQAKQAMDEADKTEGVSIETKEELQEAMAEATGAYEELQRAQKEALEAEKEYDSAMESSETNLEEVERASLKAATAADNLRMAQQNVTESTEKVSEATAKVSEETERAGQTGINVISTLAGALTTAGIAKAITEITESVYGLATAFSEAQSTVVLATGATNETLDSLSDTMMDVYSTSKSGDLQNTAGAIGEINTRLGYTGEALKDTADMFIDFAAVTGGDAAGAVKNVTQLMNQWNVDGEEMETTLSKLTYAGQASGISVGNLSSLLINQKAVLDQLGFSLDEAIAMFMNFELQGTNASQVMMGFRSALAKGDISSLEELYQVLDDIKQGFMTTADASDMFGNRAGPAIVNAAKNGVFELGELTNALSNSSGLLEQTADTAQTLDEKWQQAGKNIQTAFTNELEPTVSDLSESFAGITNSVGDYLNQHPALVDAISAIGVGLGTIATGLMGISALATAKAIPAIQTFITTLTGAFGGPAGWVVLGIGAAVTALTAFITLTDDAAGSTERMTVKSEELSGEIEQQRAEYDKVCQTMGANSEEAQRLALSIYELEDEYERSAKTVEEFNEEISKQKENFENTSQGYDDQISEIEEMRNGSTELVGALAALAAQGVSTGTNLDMMNEIVEELNSNYENLGLTIDQSTGKLNYSVSDLYSQIMAEADKEKKAAATKSLTKFVAGYGDARKTNQEAYDEYMLAEENYQAADDKYRNEMLRTHMVPQEYHDAIQAWQEAQKEYEETSGTVELYADKIRELGDELGMSGEQMDQFISQLEQAADDQDALARGAENITNAQDAANYALADCRESIISLKNAYSEAYEEALKSFTGQFGLFEEAERNIDATVGNATATLQSQAEYWETYTANIEKLKNLTAKDLGLSDDEFGTAEEKLNSLMIKVQDGSADAAGLAQSMVNNINQGNEEAVAKLADTNARLNNAQQEAARITADWQTNYSSQLDEFTGKMDKVIDGLDLSDEAKTDAKNTIDAYIKEITKKANEAAEAAANVTDAVTKQLEGTTPTITVNVKRNYIDDDGTNTDTDTTSEPIAKNATGGIYDSPTLTWVAEAGDSEAIIPLNDTPRAFDLWKEAGAAIGAIETDISNIDMGKENEPGYNTTAYDTMAHDPWKEAGAAIRTIKTGFSDIDTGNIGKEEETRYNTTTEKNIVVKLEGGGEIKIPNTMSKQDVLNLLVENTKPVLLKILQQEVFEEGDVAYAI